MLGVFPDTALIESLLKALENQNKADYGFQVLTTSQTWTAPANLRKQIHILAIGGGGGGGGGYSTTYAGGGGAGAVILYTKMAVTPGTTLDVVIGAGGAGGKGGASPTAGAQGGNTLIQYNGTWIVQAPGAVGGGAATPSADGTGGPAPGTMGVQVPVGAPLMILDYSTEAGGAGGNGSSSGGGPAGGTPPFLPGFTSSANCSYGSSNSPSYGFGGAGGGVNADGQPGQQGVVVIWWGE